MLTAGEKKTLGTRGGRISKGGKEHGKYAQRTQPEGTASISSDRRKLQIGLKIQACEENTATRGCRLTGNVKNLDHKRGGRKRRGVRGGDVLGKPRRSRASVSDAKYFWGKKTREGEGKGGATLIESLRSIGGEAGKHFRGIQARAENG